MALREPDPVPRWQHRRLPLTRTEPPQRGVSSHGICTTRRHHRRRHRRHQPRRRTRLSRLDRHHRRGAGSARPARRLDVPRPGVGLPDQPVEVDDPVREVHRREAPLAGVRRAQLLQPGGRAGGRDHSGAARGAQAQARLCRVLGHRGALDRHRRVRAAVSAARSGRHPGRPAHSQRRSGAGGSRHSAADRAHPRGRGDLSRLDAGHRHRAGRRPGDRGGHPGPDHSRRHRRLLRRLLGCRGRRHGRHGDPAAAAGPPVRQDDGRAPAEGPQRSAQRSQPADPAPPGPGPVLPRTRRPVRHRLLRPPPDAGRRRLAGTDAEARRRAAHAVAAGVHPGGFRAGLEGIAGAVAGAARQPRSPTGSTGSSPSPPTAARSSASRRTSTVSGSPRRCG